MSFGHAQGVTPCITSVKNTESTVSGRSSAGESLAYTALNTSRLCGKDPGMLSLKLEWVGGEVENVSPLCETPHKCLVPADAGRMIWEMTCWQTS